MTTDPKNPCGLRGLSFVEFASPEPARLDGLFQAFGFSRLKRHAKKDVLYYRQNDIHFLLNREHGGFASQFAEKHGPSLCAMGWKVDDEESD